MTRYIDADALLQKWEERHRPNFHENTGAYYEYLQTYWAIKDAPTADVVEVTDKSMESLIKGLEILGDNKDRADVVEVVRCKECKHWHSNTEFCGIWSFHFQNIAQRTLRDDYCSRAERREE